MDANQEEKRKKKKNTKPSFSSLPDEILMNCLARASRTHYRSLSLVSKTIRSLIYSPELYKNRSCIGNTEPCLYICQRLPTYDLWYTLPITYDGCLKDKSSLSPVTPSTSLSTTVAVGFEIYQIGGTINGRPSSAVRVLDCRTHTWRDGPNMTVPMKRAHSFIINGKIFVLGGTEESKNNLIEVFDLQTQTWKPLPSLGVNTKFKLYRGEIYATSERGLRYAYDSKEGGWKQVYLHPYPDQVYSRSGPWCFIENVKFSLVYLRFKWYDSERANWFRVEGLEYLYKYHCFVHPTTVRLANHGGKLVIIWDEFLMEGKFVRNKHLCQNKTIWCAVIRLEKKGLEIWGEIERLNALLTIPNSYRVLSCITL